MQQPAAFEQFAHPDAQFLGVERLGEIGVGTGLQAFEPFLFGDFGSDDDDGDMIGHLVGTHLPADLQSVGFGHHQIGDDKVRNERLRLLQSLPAVGSIEDGILAGEMRTDVGGHVGIVLDDEDPAFVASLSTVSGYCLGLVWHDGDRLGLLFLFLFLFDVLMDGESDLEKCTSPRPAFHTDGASQFVDQLFHEGKPDSRPYVLRVGFCLIERLKDVGCRLLVYSLPVVDDVDAQAVSLTP